MAKREECHFDSDNFIESVREDAVPGYHTANDSVNTAPPESDKPPKKAAKKAEVAEEPPEMMNDWFDPDEIDAIEKYQSLNMTDSEIEFIKDFIVNNNFRQVTQKGRQVMIRERHRKRIKAILEMLSEDANMATYIDNVLTEHFKHYYKIIMGIAKKCPPKL